MNADHARIKKFNYFKGSGCFYRRQDRGWRAPLIIVDRPPGCDPLRVATNDIILFTKPAKSRYLFKPAARSSGCVANSTPGLVADVSERYAAVVGSRVNIVATRKGSPQGMLRVN